MATASSDAGTSIANKTCKEHGTADPILMRRRTETLGSVTVDQPRGQSCTATDMPTATVRVTEHRIQTHVARHQQLQDNLEYASGGPWGYTCCCRRCRAAEARGAVELTERDAPVESERDELIAAVGLAIARLRHDPRGPDNPQEELPTRTRPLRQAAWGGPLLCAYCANLLWPAVCGLPAAVQVRGQKLAVPLSVHPSQEPRRRVSLPAPRRSPPRARRRGGPG